MSLAKAVSLGVGTGWSELECEAYGIRLGSVKERFDRFDEALEVLYGLLRQESFTFRGQYYQLSHARNEPKGLQSRIPICIGGLGEQRTLRAVARYADHWNLPGFEVDMYRHKRSVLAAHCTAVGRDLDEIRTSAHVVVNSDTAPQEIVEQIRDQEKAGLDQAIVYFQPPVTLRQVVAVTDVLSAEFGELPPNQ